MEARAPFDMFALGAASYSKPVCIECYNGVQWAYNSFTATYAGRPDCSADLVLANRGQTSTLAYDATNTDSSFNLAIPSNGNADFITNTNSKCPVTTCYLKANDCATALDAGSAAFITATPEAPFYIYAVNNVAAGWSTQVCYICENGAQALSTLVSFTQTPAYTCANDLSALPGARTSYTIPYAAAGAAVPLNPSGWAAYLTSNAQASCAMTACTLRATGGATAYPNDSKLSIGTASPWVVSAGSSTSAGWTQSVVVRCTNSGSQVVDTPITVT